MSFKKLEKTVQDLDTGEYDLAVQQEKDKALKGALELVPKLRPQRVMIGERAIFAINLMAQFKTDAEVRKLLKDLHQVEVKQQCIWSFRKAHEKEIAESRQKYLARANDIPIAIEKVRLEREEALYQLSQNLGDDADKIDYGLKCLSEARAELKGSNSNMTFNQYNQTNLQMLTDAQLLQKIKETEEKIVLLSKREKDGAYAVQK